MTLGPAGSQRLHEDMNRTATTEPTFQFTEPESWATLNDGSTVKFREVLPADADAIRELYASLRPESLYVRFFSSSPASVEQDIDRLTRRAPEQHEALVGEHDGRLVAVGCYEVTADSTKAEIAMVMGEDQHGLGLGSAFVRHLAMVARTKGVHSFVAETLNRGDFMTEALRNLKLPLRMLSADLGTIEYEVELP